MLKVALPGVRGRRRAGRADARAVGLLLHLRPRLRPRLAPDRDHQRARRAPARHCDLVVRTSAPRWLFDRTVRVADHVHRRRDATPASSRSTACVSTNRATIARAADVLSQRCPRAPTREAALPARARRPLVVSDAPPLACAAAARRRHPVGRRRRISPGTGSTRATPSSSRAAPDLLPAIRDAYAQAAEGVAAADARRLRDVRPRRSTSRSSRGTHARSIARRRAARAVAAARRAARARRRSAATASADFDPSRLDCLDDVGVVMTGASRADRSHRRPALRSPRKTSTTRACATTISSPPSTSSSPSRATASSPSASPTTPRCSTPRAAASPSTT